VEAACQALASHAFDVGVTARATTATDLRFAALLSGDFGGVLAGACLVDGVVGGTLKQRVGRSKLARDLLTHLLTDEFIAARRASVS
jgi:cellulose synthase operon protein C